MNQIVMFIGFLEYVISQIVLKPGYIPGDYVGSNDLFDGGEGDSTWRNFQVKGEKTEARQEKNDKRGVPRFAGRGRGRGTLCIFRVSQYLSKRTMAGACQQSMDRAACRVFSGQAAFHKDVSSFLVMIVAFAAPSFVLPWVD